MRFNIVLCSLDCLAHHVMSNMGVNRRQIMKMLIMVVEKIGVDLWIIIKSISIWDIYVGMILLMEK
jgi:hypothetical protein